MTMATTSPFKKKAAPAATPPVDFQEFEAPREVIVLVAEVMLHLGADKTVAREAARTGRILIDGQRLLLACAPGDSALIISALLDPDWATPAARKALLEATAGMMLSSGVVATDGYGGPSLMCRWPLAEPQAAALAVRLRELAGFAIGIQTKRY
ncbi:MAG TPA: type III secretion system chaperone [Burkholderiaceae bacterium]